MNRQWNKKTSRSFFLLTLAGEEHRKACCGFERIVYFPGSEFSFPVAAIFCRPMQRQHIDISHALKRSRFVEKIRVDFCRMRKTP